MVNGLEKERVWDLEKLTNGEYAALRRAAGSVEMDVAAWRAFYKVDHLGDTGANERFTALCMSCLWWPTDENEILPMEKCLRNLCWETVNGKYSLREGFARRVDALLETRWSQDGYFQGKLLNLVKIIRSDDRRFKPDFELLADDLRKWNYDSRTVQRRWLRTIYQNTSEDDAIKEENENDA